jgi:hypothetical protein
MSFIKKLFGTKEKATESELKPLIQKKSAKKNTDLNVAIAAAIFLYRQEVHDYEDTVLTIKRIDRAYSPWSSKIYSLRKVPRQI